MFAMEVASGMLQTPRPKWLESSQSSVALTVRFAIAMVGRHPRPLHAEEGAVEQQHGAVEREPQREGREARGDDVRLVRREAAVLVEQAHDRHRERGADRGGRDQQERDLAQARRDEPAEARAVPGGRAPRERGEQHGGHRHREHALRQHVDAEGLVDGRRADVGVDARGEERVDEQVEVDQPEPERDGQHEHEDALHGLVARVAEPAQVAEAAHRRIRDRELDGSAEQDPDGVRVEALRRWCAGTAG